MQVVSRISIPWLCRLVCQLWVGLDELPSPFGLWLLSSLRTTRRFQYPFDKLSRFGVTGKAVMLKCVMILVWIHQRAESPLDRLAQRRMDVNRVLHRLRAPVVCVHQIDDFLNQD